MGFEKYKNAKLNMLEFFSIKKKSNWMTWMGYTLFRNGRIADSFSADGVKKIFLFLLPGMSAIQKRLPPSMNNKLRT